MSPHHLPVKKNAVPVGLPKTKEEMTALIEKDRAVIKAQLTEVERAAFDKEFSPEETVKEHFDGSSNVLVVAPHGYPGNDNNTDYVAYLLSKGLDASYLINNKMYRKPQKKKTYGLSANLNNPWNKNPHTKDFIDRLNAGIKNIRQQSGTTPIVITIHGMDDVNADTHNLDFCIGAGYEDKDRKTAFNKKGPATASKSVIDGLLEGLNNGHKAKDGVPGFTGAKSLPAYLKSEEKQIGHVDAVQLEMRYAGLREPETVVSTVRYLAKVVKDLNEFTNGNKAVKDAEADVALVPIDEKKADEALVERACRTLTQIFSDRHEEAMLEAGRFIIKEFFNKDVELARQKKPVEEASFYQVIQELKRRTTNAPSKSWLYNAIGLVVDSQDFQGFHTYGKLLLSHKVLLLRVRDTEEKKKLIAETAKNGLTVAQLKERIGKLRNLTQSNGKTAKSLSHAVTDPVLLFSKKFEPARQMKALVKLPPRTIEGLRLKATKKVARLAESIQKLESRLKNEKAHVKKYGEFIDSLEKAQKRHSPEAPKAVGKDH
jgi:hypothetical protein